MGNFNWVLGEEKYLTSREVKRLRRVIKRMSNIALKKGNKTSVRDWFIIDLALSSGLRVQEIANLKCRDLQIYGTKSSLVVKNGKGGKSRIVKFSESFKEHVKEYLDWKTKINEALEPHSPLVLSCHTKNHITTRALQKAFKRSAKKAGLNGNYSIHSLRHTYAVNLYKASGYNLRLVQKLLGHSSVKVTEIYADIINSDLDKALKKFYQ